MARRSRRRRSCSETFALIALFMVALTTFLQIIVDYLQSKSTGAYLPTWQRLLLLFIFILSMTGLLASYMANARSSKSPIPGV